MLVALALIMTACNRGPSVTAPTPPAPAAIGGVQPVSFPSRDGAAVSAWRYGRVSENAIVLVPDAGHGRDVWEPLAQDLAASGFLVLTPDVSAQGATPSTALVRAAIAYLRVQGADKVAVIGEGAGGVVALSAGAGERVSGIAALSAPPSALGATGEVDAVAAIGRLSAPVLLMAGLSDPESSATARRLYDAAREPRTLALLPGAMRGAALLRGPEAGQARDALRGFLRDAFAPRTA